MIDNLHIPVLLEPILNFIKPEKNQVIFDGTFGGGGYVEAFLAKGLQVYSCDLDPKAIEIGQKRFEENKNLCLKQVSFADYITEFKDDFFDYIVLDLGFSSNQLACSGRGFSYQNLDEIFDLRYDQSVGKSCFELLRNASEGDLGHILYLYSGENLARFIAKQLKEVVSLNYSEPMRVRDVVERIEKTIPGKFKPKKNAILSRIWQALRIWTNQEFEALERFLPVSVEKLKSNGLLMIVDFHSLEDKIVTKFMRNKAKREVVDDYGNSEQSYKILTPHPIAPSSLEIEKNIRSRSGRLRVLQKL